jgi:hypothetical protein
LFDLARFSLKPADILIVTDKTRNQGNPDSLSPKTSRQNEEQLVQSEEDAPQITGRLLETDKLISFLVPQFKRCQTGHSRLSLCPG